MFRVVIIFIWLLQSVSADVTQNITIKFISVMLDHEHTLECLNGTTFVLKDYVPTMLYIDYSSIIGAHECSLIENSELKLDIGDFKIKQNFSEAKINTLMEGEIHCFFLTNKDNSYIRPQYLYNNHLYTRVDCSFKIVIKYWKNVNLKINGNLLNTNLVDSSNEVDAKAEYYFVPKERVDITCFILDLLLYVPSVAVVCPQYDYSSESEFDESNVQMLLEAHHNNTYIDCVLDTMDCVTVIRVYMLLKNNYDEGNIIQINGMAIRNTTKEETNTVVVYEYYGHVPSVTCPSTNQFTMAPEIKSKYEAVVVCNINGENTTVKLLKQRPPNEGIYIDGLDDGKILFHTYYNDLQNRVIHYSYTDNDVLEFNFWYGFEHQNVIWTLEGFNNSDNHTNSFIYSMKEEYDLGQVIVKLERGTGETIIVFHYRKKDVTLETGGNKNVQRTEDTSTINAVCVGLVVVVVVGVLISVSVYIIRRRCNKTPPRPPLALPIQTEPEQQNEYDYVYAHMPNRQLKTTAAKRTVTAQRGGHRLRHTQRI